MVYEVIYDMDTVTVWNLNFIYFRKMASDISYNKLSIPESLDELSEKIIKVRQYYFN